MPGLMGHLLLNMLLLHAAPVIRACADSRHTTKLWGMGAAKLRHISGLDFFFCTEGKRVPLAVAGFLLVLPEEERQSLLTCMAERALSVLFLDFKKPERNIELPAAFLTLCLRCLCNIKIKDCPGGLEALLYAEKHRFKVKKRHTLLAGVLIAAETEVVSYIHE